MFDLEKLNGISVGVIGDLALDIYWIADMRKSELSRETPHYPLPVVSEKIHIGAGGNVCANIAALRPGRLAVCGLYGDDWRGALLMEQLVSLHADLSGVIREEGRFTQAYCKPMRCGISDVVYEDPRIDFASACPPCEETENAVLAWLDAVDGKMDILCVCDQFPCGIITDAVRARLASMKTPIAVDSRYHIGEYRGRGVLKPNEDECRAALRACGARLAGTESGLTLAGMLAEQTGMDVFLTCGAKGSYFYSRKDGSHFHTAAVTCEGPIDICGAGDASLSAFACCLAAGASPAEAAQVASFASAVTIRKIGVTGTSSREEILRCRGMVSGKEGTDK